MSFDRDSFLKGVITGMRLPRTPGGQKPLPPVPQGKYILTESGQRIMMEKPDDPEGIIMTPGEWYTFPNSYPVQYFRLSLLEGISASDIFYFTTNSLNTNTTFCFVISSRLVESELIGYIENAISIPDSEHITMRETVDPSTKPYLSDWSYPDEWYTYLIGRWYFADVDPLEGVNTFTGTPEEFRSFLGEVKYMITEQGVR